MTTSDTGMPENLPGFDDPIGLLRACHEKMLHHCDLLESLLGRNDMDSDSREAARNITRYFTRSAPLHHRDEEEDIFPRINRLSLKTAELIHNLKKEHERLDALWSTIAPGLKKLPDEGFGDAFRQAAEEFIALYRQHIGRENRDLLPLAANSLSQQVLIEVGESMARRRGVRFSATQA
jgi:hemerythrin-like domain-containing protein